MWSMDAGWHWYTNMGSPTATNKPLREEMLTDREALPVQEIGDMWEISVPPSQFCCESKTTLNKPKILKIFEGYQKVDFSRILRLPWLPSAFPPSLPAGGGLPPSLLTLSAMPDTSSPLPLPASHASQLPHPCLPPGCQCLPQPSLYSLCHVVTLLFSVIYKTHTAHEFVFLIPVRGFGIQFVWKSDCNIM